MAGPSPHHLLLRISYFDITYFDITYFDITY